MLDVTSTRHRRSTALGCGMVQHQQSRSFVPKADNANGEHAAHLGQCIPATGTLVETYLASRKITIPIPDVLRFHPASSIPTAACGRPWWLGSTWRRSRRDPRTYLKRDGSGKAPIERQRLMLGRCAAARCAFQNLPRSSRLAKASRLV